MASLPALPPRKASNLPQLPPRTPAPEGTTQPEPQSSNQAVRPRLASRVVDSSSQSSHSSSQPTPSDQATSHTTTSNVSLPRLPQRPDLVSPQVAEESSAPVSASSGPKRNPISTSQPSRAPINAFGFRPPTSNAESSSGSEKPSLPRRTDLPAAGDAPSQPPAPLPPRSQNTSSNSTPSSRPPLPNRRTQSVAPPVLPRSMSPPVILPPSSSTQPSPSYPPNQHSSHTPATTGPPPLPSHSPPPFLPTSSPPPLPPSVSVSLAPTHNLAAPSIPVSRSAGPSAPKKNTPGMPTPGLGQTSRTGIAARSRSEAPPPIDRSKQPIEKADNATSSHSASTLAVGGQTSKTSGLFLGGVSPVQHSPSAESVHRAPVIQSSMSPPPPLPPSVPNQPSPSPSNLNALLGPPPALPPSRTDTSGGRIRSKSFDSSPIAPALPPQRAKTPDSNSRGYAPSSVASSSSPSSSHTLDSVNHLHEASEHQKRGLRRTASDDGFKELVREITEDKVADGQYKVFVQSPQKQAKHLGQKEYVMMYPVEVTKGTQKWTIFRRFNQFYDLDTELKRHGISKQAGFHSDALPAKENKLFTSKKDPVILENRRRGFQQWLSEICANQAVADSDQFYMFIQPFQIGDIKPPK